MRKFEEYELTGLFYERSKEEHEQNAKKWAGEVGLIGAESVRIRVAGGSANKGR